MTVQKETNTLDQQLKTLSRSVTPERDLWTGIDHGIEHQQQSPQTGIDILPFQASRWLSSAASIAMVVAVGWFITSKPADEPQSMATLATLLTDNYQQQRQGILVSFGVEDIESLPDATRTELETIEKGIVMVNQALESDPNNVELIELLDFLHQQSFELLARSQRPRLQTL